MLRILLPFLLLIVCDASAQEVTWQHVATKTDASFRGLSVVDDSVAWVSGSKGTVGHTTNGGKDWTFQQVSGFELCDFRSIYAFNSQSVVIANAGFPAYILRTDDAGQTWQTVYQNFDSSAFIDGIDFHNSRHGVVYGDPINGHMLLLSTRDGGRTWREHGASAPVLAEGEASFAASGTTIRCRGRRKIYIATGGTAARILTSHNRGKSWKYINTPMLQGQNSTGIFSFLPLTHKHWIAAGGDYKHESVSTGNLIYTMNAGKTWQQPTTATRGYRECLAALNDSTLVAAGPTGIDISHDNGRSWQALSDLQQFHAVKRGRKGNLTVLAGSNGKLSIMKHPIAPQD